MDCRIASTMKFLVDTNIILDFLDESRGYYRESELLLILGRIGELQLWISPSQLSDVFYFATDGGKRSLAENARKVLSKLRECYRICTIGEDEYDACLESRWDDLEDALVYRAALSIDADAIITRNQKDYDSSSIPVYDCAEFFSWLKKVKGIDYSFVVL